MSVAPLHYSASAVPDVREFAVTMAQRGFTVSAQIAALLAELLDQSQKFILPDGGRMFAGETWKQAEIDALRLPYSAIAAEYHVGQEFAHPSGPMTIPVSRRIALAVDIGAGADRLLRMTGEGPDEDPDRLVLVWPICRADRDTRWAPYPTGVLVRRGDSVVPFDSEHHLVAPNAHLTTGATTVPIRIIPMPELFQAAGGSYERAVYDTTDELRAITELCAVLNCSNIETRTISPRRKQGRGKNKRKLYEYRTLEVAPSSGRQTEPGQPSDRRAPRIHLRRGHIRRLGEDRTTWVQACMVGSKQAGMVVKDYAVGVGS